MRNIACLALLVVSAAGAYAQSLTDAPFVYAEAGYDLQGQTDLKTHSALTSAISATSGSYSSEGISGNALARGFATYGAIKAYAQASMVKTANVSVSGMAHGGGSFFDPLIFNGLLPEETYDVVIRVRIHGEFGGNSDEFAKRISGDLGLLEWDGDSFEVQGLNLYSFQYGDSTVTGGNNYWDASTDSGLVTLFGSMTSNRRYGIFGTFMADAHALSEVDGPNAVDALADFYGTSQIESFTVLGMENQVTITGASGTVYAVPEPFGLSALSLGVLAALRRGRRR